MRSLAIGAGSLVFFLPMTVLAGPLYGTIREGPNPLRSRQIEVACPDFRQPTFRITSRTDTSGSFRINVERRGRCLLRVEDVAPVTVYSSDNPIRYDFEVVPGARGPELRRR